MYEFGQRNFRGHVTGNLADNATYAPLARVGWYGDFRYGALPNRGNAWINPAEAGTLRDGHNVYATWADYWQQEFGPVHEWFTGSGAHRNMLAVFESPYGHQGLYRRDHTIDERQKALEQNLPHLVDGFCEGARTYIDAGSQIFIHEGCPDLGRLAADTLKDETPRARLQLFDAQVAFVRPHLAVGMGIGLDNLSAWNERTASFGLWLWLSNIGCPLHMEAAYLPTQTSLYGDAIVFAHWANFRGTHLEPQEPWAVAAKMPVLGTAAFESYREFRVVLPFNVVDVIEGEPLKARIERSASLSRELLGKSPKVRVLLSEWIVRQAMKEGVGVEAFLEEAK